MLCVGERFDSAYCEWSLVCFHGLLYRQSVMQMFTIVHNLYIENIWCVWFKTKCEFSLQPKYRFGERAIIERDRKKPDTYVNAKYDFHADEMSKYAHNTVVYVQIGLSWITIDYFWYAKTHMCDALCATNCQKSKLSYYTCLRKHINLYHTIVIFDIVIYSILLHSTWCCILAKEIFDICDIRAYPNEKWKHANYPINIT